MARVLVVDDFADARDLLSGFLTSRGFETEEAVDGEDAVARALEGSFDVILMDIAMPNVDGITATERLKANPRTAHVPVIAVTGQTHDPSTLCPPCDSVLIKPVDPERVEKEIRRLFALASSRGRVLSGARAQAAVGRAGERGKLESRRLLVFLIQKEDRIRGAIRHLLETSGLDVREFESGHEALHELEHASPDAVVIDLGLEDEGAIDLALAVRDEAEVASLVLIGLSSAESELDEQVRPLFDGIVEKSDDIKNLPGAIDRARRAWQPAREDEADEVSVAIGDRLYVGDAQEPFGSVMEIRRDFLMVDVPGRGAFVISAAAVISVEVGKIIVDAEALDDDLKDAIKARGSR